MSSSAPLHVIRTAAAKGSPALVVSTTAQYAWIYSDAGSGAHRDVTIYRPVPMNPSFFIIGDYAQGNYGAPVAYSLIVQAVNDDPARPLLAPPVSYNQIWNDHGSGGDNDGSIWYPVPPDGYVTVGFVAAGGYNPPLISNYRCLRRDLVAASNASGLIWDDSGSGAHLDVALYTVTGLPGAFVAQGNYDPYTGPAYQLATGPR